MVFAINKKCTPLLNKALKEEKENLRHEKLYSAPATATWQHVLTKNGIYLCFNTQVFLLGFLDGKKN